MNWSWLAYFRKHFFADSSMRLRDLSSVYLSRLNDFKPVFLGADGTGCFFWN
jgi:hypothetical protein